jgi:hypothetical protein
MLTIHVITHGHTNDHYYELVIQSIYLSSYYRNKIIIKIVCNA